MSRPLKALTKEVEFDNIPADDVNLCTVRAGFDATWAISQADNIDASVRQLLQASVQDGMEGSTAWLCCWAMEAARAYREAAGVEA